MSIKITTERGLLRLLKLLNENNITELSDPAIEKFKLNIKNDNLLNEEDSEEDEPAEESDATEEESQALPNPAAEKAKEMGDYAVDFKGSFESIEDAINLIRAGRSLKDKQINTELQDYYDRLDENERAVLLLFLKELSKILTGAVEGDDAQDPSDASTYFNITKRDSSKEKPGDEKNVIQKDGEEVEAQRKDPELSTGSGQEEDTSPPIKVNESQDISRLRKILWRIKNT